MGLYHLRRNLRCAFSAQVVTPPATAGFREVGVTEDFAAATAEFPCTKTSQTKPNNIRL